MSGYSTTRRLADAIARPKESVNTKSGVQLAGTPTGWDFCYAHERAKYTYITTDQWSWRIFAEDWILKIRHKKTPDKYTKIVFGRWPYPSSYQVLRMPLNEDAKFAHRPHKFPLQPERRRRSDVDVLQRA